MMALELIFCNEIKNTVQFLSYDLLTIVDVQTDDFWGSGSVERATAVIKVFEPVGGISPVHQKLIFGIRFVIVDEASVASLLLELEICFLVPLRWCAYNNDVSGGVSKGKSMAREV